jgi:hypothetical protein
LSLASCIIFSISLSDKLLSLSIVILCSFPVALSLALTFKIPLASISNPTSICGIPLGAGGILSKIKLPNDLLSLANFLSPCKTLISTLD